MKVLHISTEDIHGGAARAAFRLHTEINKLGASSQMLVRRKLSASNNIHQDTSITSRLGAFFDHQSLNRYPNRERVLFSSQWFWDSLNKHVARINPDIVHLHWICDGFLKIEALKKIDRPIIWTLHDMWPFTGGCHYAKDCTKYTSICGACPTLNSSISRDLSFRVLKRKISAWKNINLTIVTPTYWLAQCAKSSTLFKNRSIKVIANGINTECFRPHYKQVARDILRLPQDKKILLFVTGSTTGDPRKGFSYLVEALQLLQKEEMCDFELAVLGEEPPSEALPWTFKTHYLGKFNDEISLALVYSAADLFIAPSTQDNLPNTVVEALACGIPCITFNIGGMPDMIDHMENGFLAPPFNVKKLSGGIYTLMYDLDLYQKLSMNARAKAVKKFNIKKQAETYLDLYRETLEG
jgi:glycosyltransferase involved in cell wall biosynthesis